MFKSKSLKNFIKLLIPPVFFKLYQKFHRSAWGYTGIYASFSEAEQHANGYDSPEIIKKVLCSTKKVLAKEAVFERDSVLFYTEEYNYELIFSLYNVALQTGRLHVLDFGGALGSTFRQHLKLLKPAIKDICWNIVEQDSFLKAAESIDFEEELHFFKTIDEVMENTEIDVILFSSVLQYLENPSEIIEKAHNIRYIIIDKHPEFCTKTEPLFTVQNVSEPVYNASYPLKIWGNGELQKTFDKTHYAINTWELKFDYTQYLEDINGIKHKIKSTGMLLARRSL